MAKDHRWINAHECKRGRACEGLKLMGDQVLACHDCGFCWTDAPPTCSARRKPGFPEYEKPEAA